VSRARAHLGDLRGAVELVLVRAVLQGTLVEEVYVHPLHQDQGAEVPTAQK